MLKIVFLFKLDLATKHSKALAFLYAFEKSVNCHLLSSFLFAVFQSCTYLYSSMYFPR